MLNALRGFDAFTDQVRCGAARAGPDAVAGGARWRVVVACCASDARRPAGQSRACDWTAWLRLTPNPWPAFPPALNSITLLIPTPPAQATYYEQMPEEAAGEISGGTSFVFLICLLANTMAMLLAW